MTALGRAVRLVVDYRGRLSVRRYYRLQLVPGVLFMLSAFAGGALVVEHPVWWSAPVLIPAALCLIAMGRLMVRRMHDLGYSGLWLLAPPLLLAGALLPLGPGRYVLPAAGAIAACVLGGLMSWVKGKAEPNRYGTMPER